MPNDQYSVLKQLFLTTESRSSTHRVEVLLHMLETCTSVFEACMQVAEFRCQTTADCCLRRCDHFDTHHYWHPHASVNSRHHHCCHGNQLLMQTTTTISTERHYHRTKSIFAYAVMTCPSVRHVRVTYLQNFFTIGQPQHSSFSIPNVMAIF